MIQQNEVNKATKLNSAVFHEMLNPSYIETMYLSGTNEGIDERNLLALMNAKLNNPRFEVQFDFEQPRETRIEGKYGFSGLIYHQITIPKRACVLATTEAFKEAFDVIMVSEDEFTITYTVYLEEDYYVNVISETVYNLNCVLGPCVEEAMEKLNLVDYHLTFNIGLAY